ncbi:MAG TPA: GNAT family N-acetyltransferase, partial [Xanthobacteraceae bacterium]
MADLLTATVRAPARPRVEVPARGLVDLADVPLALWQDLAERALAPNAYYHPAWARAVAAHARGRTGAKALLAWSADGTRLTGLLPVVPAARVLHVPLPLLIAWQAYGRLGTPLIDREAAEEAVAGLLEAAAVGGARALFVPDMAASAELAGVHRALARRGMRVLRRHER